MASRSRSRPRRTTRTNTSRSQATSLTRETARRAVDQALDRFGRIDTLVNNAGIYIGKPFTDYTLDDYAAITAVNLAGFFHITQLAVAQMLEQGSGHIVNISTSLVDHADRTGPRRCRRSPRAGSSR